MNSIDLIPVDYREGIARQLRLRQIAWLVAIVCLIIVLSSAALARSTKNLRMKAQDLRTQHALTTLQQEQLDSLDLSLEYLQDEWTLLRGLRSGAIVEELFVIVDKALPGKDVWFIDWSFQRAGVIVSAPQSAVSNGYFIVLPSASEGVDEPSWQVKTHMRINGQARDHAALSRFVRGLYAQNEIQEVKLSQTQIRNYANTKVVDFELAVVLHSEPAA